MEGGRTHPHPRDRPDSRPTAQAHNRQERLDAEQRTVPAVGPILPAPAEQPVLRPHAPLRFRRPIFWGALALALLLLGVGKGWSWLARDPSWAGERVVAKLLVRPCMTLRQVADELHGLHLLDKPVRLLFAARLLGGDRAIQEGVFILDSGMSPKAMLRQLRVFSVPMLKVRIPEGGRTADVVGQLAREAGRDSLLMMQLVRDTSFVRLLGLQVPDLEGLLFPDTYFLSPADDERAILFKAVSRFQKVIDDLAGGAQDSLDLRRIATLASIVQAEYQLAGEADTIAAVYLNRLKVDMKLQADPTVQYLLPQSRRLYLKDLSIDSPYNTYRYTGLPPGPIGSPGRVALAAVLNPARCDYLYFVSRGDGSHDFSVSYGEHLRARQTLDALRARLDAGELADSASQLESAARLEQAAAARDSGQGRRTP